MDEQVSSWDRSVWMDFGSRVWAKKAFSFDFWSCFLVHRGHLCMSEVRPGIHVAVFCREPLLHAAAQTCFESHVRKLVEAGRPREAQQLWHSVVEIQHLLLPDFEPNARIPGLPAMRRAVCCAEGCVRCGSQRGGFQFPWIGRWTNRGALVWPGTPAVEAWRRYGSTAGTVDLLQLHKFICHRVFENSFPLIKTSLTQPRKRASPRTASCWRPGP